MGLGGLAGAPVHGVKENDSVNGAISEPIGNGGKWLMMVIRTLATIIRPQKRLFRP